MRSLNQETLTESETRLLYQSAFSADVMEVLTRKPGDRLIVLGMPRDAPVIRFLKYHR